MVGSELSDERNPSTRVNTAFTGISPLYVIPICWTLWFSNPTNPQKPDQIRISYPRAPHFEVTSSSDGEHYKVSISEDIFGEWGIGVSADEMSAGYSVGHRWSLHPEDGSEGT